MIRQRTISSGRRTTQSAQSGQTMTVVLLVLGLFLLAAVAFSLDLSNWWFHRQMARGAADAACTAGIMNMLVNAQGGTSGSFPAGSPPASFQCSSNSATAACRYANFNGYGAPGLTAGQPSNDVFVSFPTSVAGSSLLTCSSTVPPPCIPASLANPYLVVSVIDRVQTTFSGLVTGSKTTDVAGSAACAITQATSPVPIIVLHPSCKHAFEMSGSANLGIIGGPTRSIQVNSSNLTCAAATSGSSNQCSSNGCSASNSQCIDLTKGGPNYTGSDFGVFGAPAASPGAFKTGSSGHWVPGATPISDPYALLPAPPAPASVSLTNGLSANNVNFGVDGCPDNGGCMEFQPGLYTSPIVVTGKTAIFVPGLYYIRPASYSPASLGNCGSAGAGCLASGGGGGNCRYGLYVGANGLVRPADWNSQPGDGSKGVTFYLSGTGVGSYGSVFFDSSSGHRPPSASVTAYATTNATCNGTSPPAQLGMPTSLQGNILLGPCTSGATYIGAPGETSGNIRGLVFFQDRADADVKGQPSMQGGGGLVISGNMYFHNTANKSFFNLQGTSGGTAYVLGNITTDELVLGGTGNINMALNPNAIYHIYKATLIE